MITRKVVNKGNLPGVKLLHLLFAILFSSTLAFGQNRQSMLQLNGSNTSRNDSAFVNNQLIIPLALITYGLIAIDNDFLKYYNWEAKQALNRNFHPYFKNGDFGQYLPMASVYALNILGVKGEHNFKDRTIILASSYLIMSSTVIFLKNTTGMERPDSPSKRSFPSGHTATAFMGAEFLYQEFKDISPWYGIAGYVLASGTGFSRMVNNRHWLSDVIGGAGVGILSTKFAYWLQPYIREYIFPEKKSISGMIVPMVAKEQYGIGVLLSF